MSDVFISFTKADLPLVAEIAAALEAVDISTWYFSRDQLPGANYATSITQQIRECGCLLVVVSQATMQRSKQVDSEVTHAHENEKRIVPVLVGITFEQYKAIRNGNWQFFSGTTVGAVVDQGDIKKSLPDICRGIMDVLKEEVGREFPEYVVEQVSTPATIDLGRPIRDLDLTFDPLNLPDPAAGDGTSDSDSDLPVIDLGMVSPKPIKKKVLPDAGDPARRPVAFDVFVSAKSEDKAAAIQVFDYLNSHGLESFYSHCSLPRLGSTRYREVIDQAIEASSHFVIVASSRQHLDSGWVKAEVDMFVCEQRAGRKSGNLCTVLAGELTLIDLPIHLRSREVFDLSDQSLGRLVEFLKGQPAEKEEVAASDHVNVREAATGTSASESSAQGSPATVARPVTQESVATHAKASVNDVSSVKVDRVAAATVDPVSSTPKPAADDVVVAQAVYNRTQSSPQTHARKSKYEVREVMDTLASLAVLLTESADYHADLEVRQRLDDCGVFAYRVRTKLYERSNRYAALNDQDELRVDSVVDKLAEIVRWWQTNYAVNSANKLWRSDSLYRWESAMHGKQGFCSAISRVIALSKGS